MGRFDFLIYFSFNPNLMFRWLEDMNDEMVMLRAKIIILCHCLINVYENIMVNIFNILTFKMSEHYKPMPLAVLHCVDQ